MKRLVEADQPLYGRRTGRLDVRPFDYLDAARFAPGWSPEDKLRLYAVFGGLPGHLALVDPARSLAENAARHLLDPSGRLHDEAAHVFDAFLTDAAVHYSVVEAIASGERRWSRIASRVGKQTSALQRPRGAGDGVPPPAPEADALPARRPVPRLLVPVRRRREGAGARGPRRARRAVGAARRAEVRRGARGPRVRGGVPAVRRPGGAPL